MNQLHPPTVTLIARTSIEIKIYHFNQTEATIRSLFHQPHALTHPMTTTPQPFQTDSSLAVGVNALAEEAGVVVVELHVRLRVCFGPLLKEFDHFVRQQCSQARNQCAVLLVGKGRGKQDKESVCGIDASSKRVEMRKKNPKTKKKRLTGSTE